MKRPELPEAEKFGALGPRLTAGVERQLHNRGFAVCPSFLPQAQVAAMRDAVARLHPPYEDLVQQFGIPVPAEAHPNGICKRDAFSKLRSMCLETWLTTAFLPPAVSFPYPEAVLNQSVMDGEVIEFSKRWFDTDDIVFHPGGTLVRYPRIDERGEVMGGGHAEPDDLHIDNFSLLPPTADRHYHQLFFWFYMEDVVPEQGPTRFWPTEVTADGLVSNYDNVEQAGPTPVGDRFEEGLPAGSLVIFTSATIHGRNAYMLKTGQRYIIKHTWGRADHTFEGQGTYVPGMGNPQLNELVRSLTPREREYFHYPPVGDPYYTDATLEKLELAYPGWDASGEYAAAAVAAKGARL